MRSPFPSPYITTHQVHRFDVVITSGGVGATHDDITIKAVAAALGQGISENEDMIRRLQEAYGVGSKEELTEGEWVTGRGRKIDSSCWWHAPAPALHPTDPHHQ
jgi:hypothetical protein